MTVEAFSVELEFSLVAGGFTLICIATCEGLRTGFSMSAPCPYRTEAAFRRDYAADVEPAVKALGIQLEQAVLTQRASKTPVS